MERELSLLTPHRDPGYRWYISFEQKFYDPFMGRASARDPSYRWYISFQQEFCVPFVGRIALPLLALLQQFYVLHRL